MSLVVAPDWIESAAQELAGIRSALTEVSESIAASTTAIAPAAADEISAAIARIFGEFGEEFQIISAQTRAFHTGIVDLLGSTAGAYAGTETANAVQVVTNSVSSALAPPAAPLPGMPALPGLPALPGGPALPGLPALPELLPGLFGPGATAPDWTAFTRPYEALFNNTIANLQSLGNGLQSNPFPFLRQFLANQAHYGEIISTSLANAGASLQAGADATQVLADIAPIFTIPGQIGQNAFNVLRTLTDFSYSIGASLDPVATGAAFFGLPIAMGINAIGSPITTFDAFMSSATAFGNAMQRGDLFGAAVAVLTSPAVVTNGFLNGQVMLGLTLPALDLPLAGGVGALSVPATAGLPVGGLLTPLSTVTANIGPATGFSLLSLPLGGTPTGGILPGLLLHLPQRLAEAIGAPPQPISLVAAVPIVPAVDL
ncbi:hypothetical protein A5645_08335 [Mycobacterium asiaticum]|uniref:PE domain-containing protein n=1 Tax=Mycobacterium asiaticum TaxID=1790 RepID=UPI0007EF7277|nr:PE domain-containing protein [Mycobacterium asiaticum]OBK96447.1 hypothetical protein A5645_08335 [Mycobacterium asiaticum]